MRRLQKGSLQGGQVWNPRDYRLSIRPPFLATFAAGILAEEIGIAIEKIDNWLGKPVVITCNEVTMVQLPHVLKCA